jgi:hypothetical protein
MKYATDIEGLVRNLSRLQQQLDNMRQIEGRLANTLLRLNGTRHYNAGEVMTLRNELGQKLGGLQDYIGLVSYWADVFKVSLEYAKVSNLSQQVAVSTGSVSLMSKSGGGSASFQYQIGNKTEGSYQDGGFSASGSAGWEAWAKGDAGYKWQLDGDGLKVEAGASAGAGIKTHTEGRLDFDYGIGKSHLGGQAEAGIFAQAEVHGKLTLDGDGLKVEAGASASAGAYANASADGSVSVGPLGAHGNANAGASAGANAHAQGSASLGPDGGHAQYNVGAFAGASATAGVGGGVSIGGHDLGSVEYSAGVSVGVGVEIGGELGFEGGKLNFGFDGKLAILLGLEIHWDIEIDFGEIGELAGEVAEAGWEAMKDAGEAMGDAAEWVGDAFESGFDAVGDVVGDVADFVGDIVGGIIDGIGDFLGFGDDEPSFEEMWNQVLDKLLPRLSESFDKGMDRAAALLATIPDYAVHTGNPAVAGYVIGSSMFGQAAGKAGDPGMFGVFGMDDAGSRDLGHTGDTSSQEGFGTLLGETGRAGDKGQGINQEGLGTNLSETGRTGDKGQPGGGLTGGTPGSSDQAARQATNAIGEAIAGGISVGSESMQKAAGSEGNANAMAASAVAGGIMAGSTSAGSASVAGSGETGKSGGSGQVRAGAEQTGNAAAAVIGAAAQGRDAKPGDGGNPQGRAGKLNGENDQKDGGVFGDAVSVMAGALGAGVAVGAGTVAGSTTVRSTQKSGLSKSSNQTGNTTGTGVSEQEAAYEGLQLLSLKQLEGWEEDIRYGAKGLVSFYGFETTLPEWAAIIQTNGSVVVQRKQTTYS